MIEKAYAKINLTLEIVGKTKGYHLLESIVIPIDLFDTLKFEKATKDEVVSNVEIKNNNIYLALNLFKKTFKIKDCVKITLDKKIPIGFGLGGSSADISATLRGLNRFFKLNKPLSELESLANKLGSDTLFCLYNKRAFIFGRGEQIQFLPNDKKLTFLIIYPEATLLTKEVFEQSAKTNKKTYFNFLNYALQNDYQTIIDNSKNDLLTASLALSEPFKNLYQKLRNKGLNVKMSGSGPALFIVNPKEEEFKNIKEILEDLTKFEIRKEI